VQPLCAVDGEVSVSLPVALPAYPMPEPPADLAAAIAVCRQHVTAPYVVPVGWYVEAHPACLAASFVDDTYHILISGQSRAGKDTLALTMLLALAGDLAQLSADCYIP
jgi:RecA-family ATPase